MGTGHKQYKRCDGYGRKSIDRMADMTIEYISNIEATNQDGVPVMLWKFIDENGNLWNTETPIDGTEQDAASIILASVISE